MKHFYKSGIYLKQKGKNLVPGGLGPEFRGQKTTDISQLPPEDFLSVLAPEGSALWVR